MKNTGMIIILAASLSLWGCDDTDPVGPSPDSAPADGAVDISVDLPAPDSPLPSCTDKIKNGDETDTDCGGKTCPACANGKKCDGADDCTSGVCTSGICAAPSCTDKVKNGDETDIDCGGATCPKCAANQACAKAGDCASGVCSAGVCTKASCTDKVKNGSETDLDCGGGACPACADGKNCTGATDCASGVCTSGLCAAASCTDKIKNGLETDVDCGGGTCSACATGKKCSNSTDCSPGICDTNVCRVAASCKEIHAAHPKLGSGNYSIKVGSTTLTVTCEMTSHGGGWTLIGSVVNGVTRRWKSVAAFTGTATFGTLAKAKTDNFKSSVWTALAGDDLLVETNEYSFGFTKLLGSKAFGPYIKANWPSGCNTKWARSGASFSTKLSATQTKAMSFILRGKDTNASCFPSTNENAAVGFIAPECCWVGGLGNNPNGGAWGSHDLSLLKLSRLKAFKCPTTGYPCNTLGYQIDSYTTGGSFCYDASCKVKYALVYVR